MFRKRLMTESNLSNIQNAKDNSYFYYSEYMSDIFIKKMEERYGGRLKCNRAAKIIQNAFRMYRLKTKLICNTNKDNFKEKSKRNRSLPEKLDNLDDQYDTPYSSSDSVNWYSNRFKIKKNRISMFESMNYGSSKVLSDSPVSDSSDDCDYEIPQNTTRSTSSLNNKRKQISQKTQAYSKIQIGDTLSCKCEEELERYQTSCHGSRSKKSNDEKFDDDSYTDSCSTSSQSSSVGKQNSCVNINNKREINKNEMLPPPMPVISPQSPWKPSLTTGSVLSVTTTTNSVASINSNTTTSTLSSSTSTATTTANIVNIQKSPRDSGFSSHSSNTDLLLMTSNNNIGAGCLISGGVQDSVLTSNQNQAPMKLNNIPAQDSPRVSRLLSNSTPCKPTSIPSIMTSSRDSGIIENTQPQTPQPHPTTPISASFKETIPACTTSSSTPKPSCNCSLVATILAPCTVVTSDTNSTVTKATTLLLRSPCVYVATSSASNVNKSGYLDNRLSYIITSSNNNDITIAHNQSLNRQISNTPSQSTNSSNDNNNNNSSMINRQSSDDSYKSWISMHSTSSNENKQWIRNIMNRLAINLFNRDATVGLEFLRDHNLLSLNSPNDLAQFLQSQQLHPKVVTEFFTAPRIYTAFHIMVFKSFIRQLNLEGFDFLDATEIFLSSIFIPTDPSKLQFLLSEFTHYFCTNLHSSSNCCKGKLCHLIHEKVARIIALLKISIQQTSSLISTSCTSSTSYSATSSTVSSNQSKINFNNGHPCFSFAEFVKKITGCYKSSKLPCPYTMDYLQRSYINLTSYKLPINRALFSELLVNRIESFPSQPSQTMVTKDKKSMVPKEFLGDKNNKSVTKFYFQAPYRRVTYFCDIYQLYTKPQISSSTNSSDKCKTKQHSRTLFLFNDSIIITRPLTKSPSQQSSGSGPAAASSGSVSMRVLQTKFRCEDIVSFLHYEVDLEHTRQNPSYLQLVPLKSHTNSGVASSSSISLPPLQFNCMSPQNCAALIHKMLQSQLECRCIEQMRSLHWRCHHNNPYNSSSTSSASPPFIQSLHNCVIHKIITDNVHLYHGE